MEVLFCRIESRVETIAGDQATHENDREKHGKNEAVESLPTKQQQAYLSFEYACERQLRVLKDEEAHEWLISHRDDLERIDVQPKYANWSRNLRNARKKLSAPKNTPRANRESRNVVRESEVEHPGLGQRTSGGTATYGDREQTIARLLDLAGNLLMSDNGEADSAW